MYRTYINTFLISVRKSVYSSMYLTGNLNIYETNGRRDYSNSVCFRLKSTFYFRLCTVVNYVRTCMNVIILACILVKRLNSTVQNSS